MSHNSQFRTAHHLKTSASQLLSDILGPVLNSHGDFTIVGSMALDLMVWPDIDLQFQPKQADAIKAMCDLSKDLLNNSYVKNVKLINFYGRTDSKFSPGICMCMIMRPIEGIQWKVDVWIQDEFESSKTISLTKQFAQKLCDDSRALILQWKHRLLDSQGRVVKHGSLAVYQAVLEHGITEESEMIAFLGSKGIELPNG